MYEDKLHYEYLTFDFGILWFLFVVLFFSFTLYIELLNHVLQYKKQG